MINLKRPKESRSWKSLGSQQDLSCYGKLSSDNAQETGIVYVKCRMAGELMHDITETV